MTKIGTVEIAGQTYDVVADCSNSRRHGTPTTGIVEDYDGPADAWDGDWEQIVDDDCNTVEVPMVHCSKMSRWIGEE